VIRKSRQEPEGTEKKQATDGYKIKAQKRKHLSKSETPNGPVDKGGGGGGKKKKKKETLERKESALEQATSGTMRTQQWIDRRRRALILGVPKQVYGNKKIN